MGKATCSIPDCGRPFYARTWCQLHYRRWCTHGDPLMVDRGPSISEKLAARTDVTGDCWVWVGPLNNKGYGKQGSAYAHRLSYEIHKGPIPAGLDLDHLCHSRDLSCRGGDTCPHRRCVNPDHLEPVTHAVNMQRGRGGVAARERAAGLTHCKHGHEYTPENIRVSKEGTRGCRTCQRKAARSWPGRAEWKRDWRAKRRAAGLARA